MSTHSEDVTIEIQGQDVFVGVSYEFQPAEAATFDCPGSAEELIVVSAELSAYDDKAGKLQQFSSDSRGVDMSWLLEIEGIHDDIIDQIIAIAEQEAESRARG